MTPGQSDPDPGSDPGSDPGADRGPGRRRRAAAMPPDERRAAIAAATLTLLLERGRSVNTREIAEAAGIAEGTIFRAFPDKDAVVQAAVDLAFDPAPTEQAFAAIDRSLPFEAQLAEAAAIIQRRLSDIWRLVSTLGERPKASGPPPESAALADLFAAHRHQVRLDPAAAARQLRALTLAVTHPALAGDEPLSPTEIVSLLLDGIRNRPDGDGPHDARQRSHGDHPDRTGDSPDVDRPAEAPEPSDRPRSRAAAAPEPPEAPC